MLQQILESVVDGVVTRLSSSIRYDAQTDFFNEFSHESLSNELIYTVRKL